MKRLFPLLFLLVAGIADADTNVDLLNQLKNAAKAEFRTSPAAKDPVEQSRLEQLRQSIVQLDQTEQDDEANSNRLRAVETLGIITTSDKVADLSQTLARQLRAEQKKQDAAAGMEIERKFRSALRTTLSAKTAKDMDAPIAAMAETVKEINSRSYRDVRLVMLASQGEQLSNFLRGWQDYLATPDNGDRTSHVMRVQMLLSGGDFSAYVPRSEFLTRLTELRPLPKEKKTLDESSQEDPAALSAPERNSRGPSAEDEAIKVINDTPDLKDLGEAIRKFEAMRENGKNVALPLNSLQKLQQIYLDLESGRATSIHVLDISETADSAYAPALSRLRLQLRLYALPRALELGKEGAVQPRENSVNYLLRIAATAREKKDWAQLGRIVELGQALRIEIATNGSDRTALQSFLAGMNQQRAGQYSLAVSSFEAALKTGSSIIPPEAIGEQLEAIRKEHPADYDQGAHDALPRAPSPFPVFMDPRSRMPNFPGAPYGQPGGMPPSAPTISIPAAAPQALPAPGDINAK